MFFVALTKVASREFQEYLRCPLNLNNTAKQMGVTIPVRARACG